PGFCVPAAAYAQWAACTGRRHSALATQAIPAGLYNAVAAAYRGLATRCGVADPSVAVRSSAVDEDGATLSFAGQYETYLNGVGIDAVARSGCAVLDLRAHGTRPGVPPRAEPARQGHASRYADPAACPGRRRYRGV